MSTASTNYKCNTCGLTFGAADYQREHMKTDWHRYNLKRRLADLPPIPADLFAQKMHQVRQQELEAPPSQRQVTKKDLKRQEKQAKRKEQLRSGIAGLKLGTDAEGVAYTPGEASHNYISSASEFSNTDVSESESDLDGAGHDDVDKLLKEKLKNFVRMDSNVCFMDGHQSETAYENVKYMAQKYGLVVPEEEHVADWDGLVGYFNEKVGLGNCCLSCHYMGRSLAAARTHMLDKQHVKIPWDTEEEQAEIIDFYDFDFEDEEWDDLDGEAVDDIDNADDEESVISATSTPQWPYIRGYELILGSSGHAAGHRSLNRYFKQRVTAAKEQPGRKAVRLIDYRSPGVTERAADKMVRAERLEQQKAQQKYAVGRCMQNHQKHFRDPLLQ